MKFLALLGTCLCVSGALAQAPSDVLVDEFTITFNAYFEHTTPVLEAGQTYFMTIDGHYNISSGTYGHKDAAWYYCYSGCSEGCNVNTPCPSMDSDHWNASITSLRPDTDVYDANHHYEYTFEGDGSAMVFDFGDSAYGDNGGSLAVSIYQMPTPVPGCTDVAACNYNPEATEDDGSCVEPLVGDDCNTGSAACGDGQGWNPETQTCLTLTLFDSNFDGCITNSDLIDFLAVYGLCMEAESTGFAECGDPVSYQGYDYTTVLIGDQCRFAENLRVLASSAGIPFEVAETDEEWQSLYDASTPAFCYPMFFDSYGEEYAPLYNIHAILGDEFCPVGWHVSTDADWMDLEIELGMPLEALLDNALRADYLIAGAIKDDVLWNGTNETGFSVVPAGEKGGYNGFAPLGHSAAFLTSTQPGGFSSYVGRGLGNGGEISRGYYFERGGYSIRCVKD